MKNWHTESSATTAIVSQILSATLKKKSSVLILFHITSAYNKPVIIYSSQKTIDLADGAVKCIMTRETQRTEPCYKSTPWHLLEPHHPLHRGGSKAGYRAKEEAWQFPPPRKVNLKIHKIIQPSTLNITKSHRQMQKGTFLQVMLNFWPVPPSSLEEEPVSWWFWLVQVF